MTKRNLTEYLKKSPDGYYVLLISRDEYLKINKFSDVIVESVGTDKYLIKTKSRRVYIKILKILKRV